MVSRSRMRLFPLVGLFFSSQLFHVLSGVDDAPFQGPFNDGPYVFHKNGKLELFSIRNGALSKRSAEYGESFPLEGLGMSLSIARPEPHPAPEQVEFSNDRPLFVVSDVHGQCDLFRRLLHRHEVIDADGSWKFGRGQLVVIGDMMDRGPQVTQVLWLLYRLEQQAKAAGGLVSVLLGNHELMVIRGRVDYVHDVYLKQTVPLIGRSMPELFGRDSELGRWLRNKPVLIRVGEFLFVHGGLEQQCVQTFPTIAAMNQQAAKGFDLSKEQVGANPLFSFLFGRQGPFWTRVYFPEKGHRPGKPIAWLPTVLAHYGAKFIVIGHTTQDQILSLQGGRVIAVDAGFKYGLSGEGLLIQAGKLERCLLDGSKQVLKAGL